MRLTTDLCRETVAVVDRFNTQCYMPWKKLTQHMVLQYLRLKQDMETWLSRVLSTFHAWQQISLALLQKSVKHSDRRLMYNTRGIIATNMQNWNAHNCKHTNYQYLFKKKIHLYKFHSKILVMQWCILVWKNISS